jgi:predicted kinase
VRRLGERIAAVHADSPRTEVAAASATTAAMLARWDRLVTSVAALDSARAGLAARIRDHAARYLEGRTTLFDERIATGCARDGHGDLLADDVFLLDDGPRILDCLDFDESLRAGDVLADVAFLAMDLERLGRPDLAGDFLDAYRQAAGADWPPSLEHHHIAERALVRADVSFIRGAQAGGGFVDLGRKLLALSAAHLERGRVRVVVVCGPPGTGKSTLAAPVAERFDAVLLRTDVVRSEVAEAPDRYRAEAIDRVYDELLQRAAAELARGRSVVLDGTWSTEGKRAAAQRLAVDAVADLTVLECDVAADVAEARVRDRLAAGHDASEATVEVARRRRREWRAWPGAHLVRTDRPIEAAVGDAVRAVGGS